MNIEKLLKDVGWSRVVSFVLPAMACFYLGGLLYERGAIAHAEGRVAVTTLPDGSKVVTTVKENK